MEGDIEVLKARLDQLERMRDEIAHNPELAKRLTDEILLVRSQLLLAQHRAASAER